MALSLTVKDLVLVAALVLSLVSCAGLETFSDNASAPADPNNPNGPTVGERILTDTGVLLGDEEIAGYGGLALAVLSLFLRRGDKKKNSEKTAALHKRVNALDDTGKTQPKP